MFYYKKGLMRRVRLHPQYIKQGVDMSLMVKQKLLQDVKDHRFSLKDGYIIKVICITKIGTGYCLPLVGFVEYSVEFEAVVLYPVIGEVVFAKVVEVKEEGVVFQYSGVFGVVRPYSLDEEYKFEMKEVSASDKEHDLCALKEGVLRSQLDSEKVISKGCFAKIRILRRTLGGDGFFLVGSMLGEFLGPLPPTLPVHESELIAALQEPESNAASESSGYKTLSEPDEKVD